MRFADLKIKWKIILAASLFIPIAIGVVTLVFNQVYALEARTALAGLMNFADAKQHGVIRFIGTNEKLARQLALLASQAPSEITRNYFAEIVATDIFRPEDHPFRQEIEAGTRHIPTFRVYHAIDFVEDGAIVVSSDPAREGRRMDRAVDLRHGYSDVYLDGDTPVLTFGAPGGRGMVYVHADARMLTNIVNGEIGNLEGDMGAFYLAGVGKTFDYYLVNADNLLITESRVHSDALLKRRGSEFPWRTTRQDPSLGIDCNARGVYTTNAGCVTGCREAMGFYTGANGKLMLGASMPFYDSGWTLVVEQEADELLQPLTSLRNRLYLFIVVTGMACFLVFFAIIDRYISHPIGRLIDSIRRVEQSGDLSHRSNMSGNDEIGQTGKAFDNMVIALQAEKERQQALNKELQATQGQLLQSEKMASIGQLAAGVAHEINNPIGFVNSNLGTLKTYLDDIFLLLHAYDETESLLAAYPEISTNIHALKARIELSYLEEDAPALLAESREGLARVKGIVQGLKDFSRKDREQWEHADMRECLDSTLNIVWNEIKYKAEVVKNYGDLPRIECMPMQLNQVFMNLLVNAAQAIEGHGTITLGTGADDREVWIEIADTGKGIPPEHLKTIFDPFFTTKPVGQGTGLGLSIAYGIIERHGGKITVKSEVGKGTAFTMRLPIKQADRGEE